MDRTRPTGPAGARLDHLVLGVPELEGAVERLAREWGCRVYPGGRHPGWGTWNALVPLQGGAYLEIVAPHPDPPGTGPRIFGLDGLEGESLVTWAARPGSSDPDSVEELSEAARRAGVAMGDVLPGERRTPAGRLLSWTLTDPFAPRLSGTVPFLIQWGATPHPSGVGAPECALVSLEACHPDAPALRSVLAALGLDGVCLVRQGAGAGLEARIMTPRGEVVLRRL